MKTLYCYHFTVPVAHARHYLGITKNLTVRHSQHCGGKAYQGNPLMHAATSAGPVILMIVGFGNYGDETRLKKWRNVGKVCPICRAARTAAAGLALIRSCPVPLSVATLAQQSELPLFRHTATRHIVAAEDFRLGRLARRVGQPLCGLALAGRTFDNLPHGIQLAPTCRECIARAERMAKK